MFLKSNYILANELIQKMGISMANISRLVNEFENEGDMTTTLKMNNCTFIKTNSYKLPRNIKNGIMMNEFTDLTDKIYVPYMYTEYGLTKKDLLNCEICLGTTKVAGKEFYVFDKEFVQKVKNKILYVLNETECNECKAKNQIDGFIKLNKRKYLVWY